MKTRVESQRNVSAGIMLNTGWNYVSLGRGNYKDMFIITVTNVLRKLVIQRSKAISSIIVFFLSAWSLNAQTSRLNLNAGIGNDKGMYKSASKKKTGETSSLIRQNVPAIKHMKIPGVKSAVVSLNGLWKFNPSPGRECWLPSDKSTNWEGIQVPGEPAMQGFKVQYDKAFAFQKEIQIPADYNGNQIMIGFDGVYSYARVFINGVFVKSHIGGFTTWNCDITTYVTAGKSATLVVEVTDIKSDISGASAYAFHPIGGILRDVYLFAKPPFNIVQLHIETDLDSAYNNALLKISCKVAGGSSGKTSLQFKLLNQFGVEVLLPNKVLDILSGDKAAIAIPVKAPLKWDAEHPNLYTLVTNLMVSGKTVESISQQIGFREITVSGNALLVNGKKIRLRGTCRHDVSATLGRCTTPGEDEDDVKLIKEANLNFVRTSHYPPSQAFLAYCDQYGLYVEEETAVCFTQNGSEKDTAYTSRYLSQFAEMIERDRNHASVIMWSLGNESVWGINFQKEYEYAKATDLYRPVIFPNFGGIPDTVKCFDIDYVHYPTYFGNNLYHAETREFSNADIPVLNDEWAHVPCYMTETLKEEQGARDFWGESMKRFWDNLSASNSAGGAIWCMVDEYFMLPDSCKGTGEWGWVDVWRRKKPEFWHVKKAHSPVQINSSVIESFQAGLPLLVPVNNRYDFTNLQELIITWKSSKGSGIVKNVNVKPGAKGIVSVPAANWQRGDSIVLSFATKDKQLVDEYLITLGTASIVFTYPPNELLTKTETGDNIIVATGNYRYSVNKATGLFDAILLDNDTLVTNGPFLNLTAMTPCQEVFYTKCPLTKWDYKNWKLKEFKTETTGTTVKFIVQGTVDTLKVNYEYLIRSGGIFSIGYEIENPPAYQIQEAGLKLELPDQYQSISWNRKSLWSVYPKDHIGRSAGQAFLYNPGPLETYRSRPAHAWLMDSKSGYFYYGPAGTDKLFPDLINDAKSLKTSLNFYNVAYKDGIKKLWVEANGNIAARMQKEKAGLLNLIVNNEWDYVNLNWGNYERKIRITNNYKNLVKFRLSKLENNLTFMY